MLQPLRSAPPIEPTAVRIHPCIRLSTLLCACTVFQPSSHSRHFAYGEASTCRKHAVTIVSELRVSAEQVSDVATVRGRQPRIFITPVDWQKRDEPNQNRAKQTRKNHKHKRIQGKHHSGDWPAPRDRPKYDGSGERYSNGHTGILQRLTNALPATDCGLRQQSHRERFGLIEHEKFFHKEEIVTGTAGRSAGQ